MRHHTRPGSTAALLLAASMFALTVAGSAQADTAVLPTTSTSDLIKAREAWGMGAAAAKVEAPLAAGAVSPLPQDKVEAAAGPSSPPIVHPLVPVPVAQVPAVPEAQISAAMKALISEREGWGTAPAGASAPVVAQAPAAAPATGASAGSGFAVLPTTSTADLIKARETWGMGAAPAKVEAPLAAGAVSPLPQDKVAVAEGPSAAPIVHALQPTPPAQPTAIPEAQIADQLKALLATRAGWGSAPAGAPAAAAPAATPTMTAQAPAATGSGFVVLPTSSTADLVKAREAWGMGAPAKAVSAPLAAGAKSPLPQDKVAVAEGPSAAPIVHALQPTPPAQPASVPEATIAGSLKELLATRSGWGTAPSVRVAAAAPAAGPAPAGDKRSAEARGCETRLREAAAAGAILFESSSAEIDSKSNATLDALVAVAKSCGKGKIRIEGHTDSSGRASKNKDLSARRAEAVANYLRKAGIARNRLQPVGYGQEKPIVSNDTPEGRAKNRRIDFTVIE